MLAGRASSMFARLYKRGITNRVVQCNLFSVPTGSYYRPTVLRGTLEHFFATL